MTNFVHLFKMGKLAYQEYIVVIAPRKVGLFNYWEDMKKMDGAKVFPKKKQALPYAEQLAKDRGLELLLHS